jgi:hypothetical protein
MPAGGPSVQLLRQGSTQAAKDNNATCAAQSVYTGSNCVPSPAVDNMSNNNRFTNTLLGQTLALKLNVRLNSMFSSMVIGGNVFTTLKSKGCSPSEKNTPATGATPVNHNLPIVVVNYLGSGKTLADLIKLADSALAGSYVPGSSSTRPTLSDLTSALDAFNSGFDECQILTGWSNRTLKTAEARLEDVKPEISKGESGIEIYPNPFDHVTNIAATFSTDRQVTIEVIDMQGKMVKTIFSGNVKGGETQFYTLDATNLGAGFYIVRFVSEAGMEYRKIAIVRE